MAKSKKIVSIDENGEAANSLSRLRERDKGKALLRIDSRTVIAVSPENNNGEYAKAYAKRLHERRNNFR